ncbi:HFL126Cp [Eremothecium sinecaudum]|uniref:Protein farnesyltransferase subunit beta n=1 Tax=Eremothecium sinecaudum TaxID=45286 RepID=A0A0X8HUI8_9SACH|nr:HFL126Cp [Eremothecium sinecaudum]AMD21730.1 HFL126Cp [Eremothecium sinecaudum]
MPLSRGILKSTVLTETLEQRRQVVEDCAKIYRDLEGKDVALNADYIRRYLEYILSCKQPLPVTPLDAAQPWLVYWILNSLKTIISNWAKEGYFDRIQSKVATFSPIGGPYAGGPGQLPHLASNYAAIAVMALCGNTNNSWDMINREYIYHWLVSLKTPDGGFKTVKQVGEIDTRGVYTALSVASMLNIMTEELTEGCVDFLLRCQSYEGGFGGAPYGDEAHGGYTYCAVGSLAILGALDRVNIPKLMDWCSARQTNEEKGLSGRTNKLVDGCYSFWIGSVAAILEAYGFGQCIDKSGLQEYILKCCQPDDRPGLRDKPGKPPDFYHTNYVALGLAAAQYNFNRDHRTNDITCTPIGETMVQPIHPIYGLPIDDVKRFKEHWTNT